MSNYVAGGIVVFNSRTRTVKWQQHLDLSTDRTAFKAYIQASPTLADINGDGKLEVIIGTNMVSQTSHSPAQVLETQYKGQPTEKQCKLIRNVHHAALSEQAQKW